MCTCIGLIAFREKQIHASNKTVLLVFLFFVIVLPLEVSTSYSWRVTCSLSIGAKVIVKYDFRQPLNGLKHLSFYRKVTRLSMMLRNASCFSWFYVLHFLQQLRHWCFYFFRVRRFLWRGDKKQNKWDDLDILRKEKKNCLFQLTFLLVHADSFCHQKNSF